MRQPDNFVVSFFARIRQAKLDSIKKERMKTNLIIALVTLLATNALFAAEKQLWAKSFINQKAPELVVEKWLSKEPDRKGKFVLIDFWATWCPPCRKAIPELNAFHKKFGDKLIVIGISDESAAKVSSFTM